MNKCTIQQLKAARALLGWSQADLAEMSGVSKPTIQRIEAPDDGPIDGRHEKAGQVIQALERAGIEFIEDVGVRLDKLKPRRR
jgi:predicted transcriptional regulator